MRVSVASAGNDHRLGANEAPPAIVSMFLGDELTEILEALVSGKAVNGKGKVQMELGVHVLPAFPKDTTDRNRTSPFAFTGNKFEFRMLGSSFSVAGPNIVLNTIVAKALKEFYEELKDATDFNAAVTELVKKTYSEHKRIVFNGNNYAPEWVVEAEKRGLLNLKSSPDAYDTFIAPKNIELFSEFGIFNSVEMHSRYEILNEEYSKTIHIEATTLIDMVNRQVLPACTGYAGKVAAAVNAKKLALPTLECKSESALISEITALVDNLENAVTELEKAVALSAEYSGSDLAHYTRNSIIPLMDDVRGYADSLELIVDQKDWPYPTYGEMLFYV